jgi:DNA mismatch repair protein MutS2
LIYPANFHFKSGFNQVCELVSGLCLSEMGRDRVAGMRFSADAREVRRLLGETSEFKAILQSGSDFPGDDYHNLTPVLDRIHLPGTWILPEELNALRLSLRTIKACLDFFRQPASQVYMLLNHLTAGLEIPPFIFTEADRILDERGQISDQASPELALIRKKIRQRTAEIEKKTAQFLEQAKSSGWASTDSSPTLSDGRLVIPVSSTHKRKIKGIIHDESASGQTVYIEPEACLELNNQVRELEGEEKREIIRILRTFTDLLRPHLDLLKQGYDFLGEIDFVRAKALFAIETDGNEPMLSEFPAMNWQNARHPILERSLRWKGKTIVPLNIKLDETERILVISGPNAGGKSVCLKTAGLLQYMLQCGLLPALGPDSVAGIFTGIFIDIGDEQSIENDLSTYSSHLLNLKFFMDQASGSTLFLVDELGAGTDPSLGGAIAESVLERLSESGAYGIVTTHYSNLKLLQGRVPGIVNGAMLFDTSRLQPLYQLSIGKPGSSFTFEIARRMGLSDDLIAQAESRAGRTHLDFEKQLQELEQEKIRLEQNLKEFQVADGFLGEMIQKYETLHAELERKKKDILEKAREEAREMLTNSNRMIESAIREIRESQAEKERSRKARQSLEELGKSLTVPKPERPANEVRSTPGTLPPLRPGSWVTIEGQQKAGKIHSIKGSRATVYFDGTKVTVSLNRLREAKEPEPDLNPKFRRILSDINEKAVNFKLSLDVRGKPADEAMILVQRYLDDAYLLRIREVSILHGKGEGILRKVIRELLASLEEVESFSDEHVERGGAGITRVVVK